MPDGADTNGSAPTDDNGALPAPKPLSCRPSVNRVFEVLQSEHGVSEDLCETLGEAFSRAALLVVDECVGGRQQPAMVGYYMARLFYGTRWWKR
jgi:hypothetical protein